LHSAAKPTNGQTHLKVVQIQSWFRQEQLVDF
jgi:hypothetical protein